MALTVSLAENICTVMNSTNDEALRYVLEQALAEVCIATNTNYINDSYVGYHITNGILRKMPKRLIA